jgi:hypothetical protein
MPDYAVWVESRQPQTPQERRVYGMTHANKMTAKIFINERYPRMLADTFFHEMAHVFFALTRNNVPSHMQERLATQIGEKCAKILTDTRRERKN